MIGFAPDVESVSLADPDLHKPCESRKAPCDRPAQWRLRNLCCGQTTLLCDPCKQANDQFIAMCYKMSWMYVYCTCGAVRPASCVHELETLEPL